MVQLFNDEAYKIQRHRLQCRMFSVLWYVFCRPSLSVRRHWSSRSTVQQESTFRKKLQSKTLCIKRILTCYALSHQCTCANLQSASQLLKNIRYTCYLHTLCALKFECKLIHSGLYCFQLHVKWEHPTPYCKKRLVNWEVIQDKNDKDGSFGLFSDNTYKSSFSDFNTDHSAASLCLLQILPTRPAKSKL